MLGIFTGIEPVLQFDIFNFYKFARGQIFSPKFEFGGSFGMSLEGDCHEVTPNLELLVTFRMSLEGVCHELYT
jgi:hypothetical protein